MPPIFIAIAVLLTDIAEVIGVTATLAIFNAVLFIGASLVLGQISKLFSKGPSSSSLTSQAASRTITSRQAVAPWRVLYGANRVGGIITALHTTGSKNEKLHIVITLAGHEVNASSTMYFDGVAVPLDGSGNATGNFAGFVHAEFNAGTRNQAAFAGFLAAAPTVWTSAYRQRGRAGWYVQLTWDQNKFPNGVPNITFDVQGRKVYDPRSGTMAYSNNAALCIADYLNNASFGLVAQTKYPVTSSMLTNSGFHGFSAVGCVDGIVTTQGWDNFPTNAGSTITVDLGSGNPQEFRRCRMYADISGQAQTYDIQYSDDNITYHQAQEYPGISPMAPNVAGWNETELAPNGAHRYWQVFANSTLNVAGSIQELEFYTSDIDSTQLISAANTCDEAVSLLAGGTQNRFSIDGSFDTSESPANVIGRMNSAMAGSVLYTAGKWGIYPGIWRAPTVSLTDADFRGPMTVQTRLTHRDLYNGVKGTFISPTNNWQPADYPPFQDPTALKEDSNEALWLDVELPFTINGAMAQRLSKIALRRVRHQITVQGQFKLTAYQVQPLDVVQLSHPRFNWTNKTFEVTACTLAYVDDGNGSTALGVDLTLREADSTIYDWSTADEVALNAPPVSVLPQNVLAQPLTGFSVSPVEITRNIDGVRMNFISVSWTAPADQFVTNGGHIVVQYKKHSDVNWTDIGKLKGNVITAQIGPVIDGTQYDIQAWAENSSGVASTISSASATPTGTSVTLDTIAEGAWATHSVQYVGGVVTIENANFEASASLVNSAPPGWAPDSGSTTASYETGSPQSGLQSLKCVFTGAFGNVFTLRKYKVIPGELYRISGYMKTLAGVNGQIQCWYGDASGTFVGQANALTTSAAWVFVTATGVVPAGAVYMVIRLGTAGGVTGTVWYDNVHVIRAATAFEVTPVNTSGHATTSGGALSQSGATTTINVASKTIQFGDGTATYNAGSVNPTVVGTYFVFADDPGYAGGAVTYQASLNESDVYAANGRIFFGKITTVGGGGATSPNPPGTGGGRVAL